MSKKKRYGLLNNWHVNYQRLQDKNRRYLKKSYRYWVMSGKPNCIVFRNHVQIWYEYKFTHKGRGLVPERQVMLRVYRIHGPFLFEVKWGNK